jgi:hypothetical protein
MKTFQLFLICACLVWQNVQADKEDVLTKRDNSVEADPYAAAPVDPYAAYYEQYAAQQHAEQTGFPIEYPIDKQGFAGSMESLLGPDAGLLLGLVGALAGTAALIGVALNNNNVNELSKDQDSICTTVKDLGASAVTPLTTAQILVMDNAAALSGTRLAAVITELNSYAAPEC